MALADDKPAPKKEAKLPERLKGEWRVTASTDGVNIFFAEKSSLAFKLHDTSAEWGAMRTGYLFMEKAGKAEISVTGTGSEGTVEIKVGGQVYRGRYRVTKEEKQ